MSTSKLAELKPIFWSILIFVVALALTFLVVIRINPFLEEQHIVVPTQPPQTITILPGPVTLPSGEITQVPASSSLVPIVLYFLAAAAVMGFILWKIPRSVLQLLLRAVFGFLFCYGTFLVLILWLPWPVTLGITAAAGLVWYITPRVWLHNSLMVLAMVSVGTVFGHMITPWTAMLMLLALAIYDFLAVRFGYMVWMAGKLTETSAVPAFFLPHHTADWTTSLKQSAATKLLDQEPVDRKYSILGGGDVGFSLLLVASVYFAHRLPAALIIAAFTLVGLLGAYWIQDKFLKGRPMPALPPIAAMSLIGLLIIR